MKILRIILLIASLLFAFILCCIITKEASKHGWRLVTYSEILEVNFANLLLLFMTPSSLITSFYFIKNIRRKVVDNSEMNNYLDEEDTEWPTYHFPIIAKIFPILLILFSFLLFYASFNIAPSTFKFTVLVSLCFCFILYSVLTLYLFRKS